MRKTCKFRLNPTRHQRALLGHALELCRELWTNSQIIYFGIDSLDPAIQAQIEALRDSGKIVHNLWHII